MRGPAPPSPRTARRWTAVALCLLSAGAGVGCADDGPSRQEFVAEAERVCAEAGRSAAQYASRIRTAQRDADPARVFGAVARLTHQAADAAQPFLDRLDALEPPPDDRDRLKTWIAGRRRQRDLAGDLARAFDRRDEATISTLSQRLAALRERDRTFAAGYGLTRCAAAAG